MNRQRSETGFFEELGLDSGSAARIGGGVSEGVACFASLLADDFAGARQLVFDRVAVERFFE